MLHTYSITGVLTKGPRERWYCTYQKTDPQLVLTEPSAQQNLLPSSETKGHKHSLDRLILWTLEEMARNTRTQWISHTINRWQRCALRGHVQDQAWSWTDQNKNLIEDTRNPQLLYIHLHSRDCQHQTALQMNGKQLQIVPVRENGNSPWHLSFFKVSQSFQSLAFSWNYLVWLQQLCTKSILTLDVYVVSLGLWCYTKLLLKPMRAQLKNLVQSHISNFKSQLQNLSLRWAATDLTDQ